MSHPSVGRFCALFSLSVAMTLTSGAAYPEEPSTAPPHEATNARKCQTVHIDADPLYGIDADDVVVCDDENPKPGLLRGSGGWSVQAPIVFDLPVGTDVTLAYVAPAGNCVSGWTETQTRKIRYAGDTATLGFNVPDYEPWESCAYVRSYASWDITAVAPSGVRKTANVRIITGLPNFFVRAADAQCHFVNGLGCAGGSDSTKDDRVKPPLRLGPMDATEWPRAPQLVCTGTAHLSIGQPMNNHHPCTVEGYPRPKIEVKGLPWGVTLTRWPSENDTWLVLNGTVNQSLHTPVTVTASLPGGWADSKEFWLEVK